MRVTPPPCPRTQCPCRLPGRSLQYQVSACQPLCSVHAVCSSEGMAMLCHALSRPLITLTFQSHARKNVTQVRGMPCSKAQGSALPRLHPRVSKKLKSTEPTSVRQSATAKQTSQAQTSQEHGTLRHTEHGGAGHMRGRAVCGAKLHAAGRRAAKHTNLHVRHVGWYVSRLCTGRLGSNQSVCSCQNTYDVHLPWTHIAAS